MKKSNPLQITMDDILKCRPYLEAKQVYIDWNDGRARQTHPCWYAEDWNEKASREYYVYLGMERLLKQIARHRKIKGFKPWPYEIYNIIDGTTDFENLLYGKTVRFHEQLAA